MQILQKFSVYFYIIRLKINANIAKIFIFNMEFTRNYYLNQLINGIDNKQVKIITGLRRCGKSYLLFKLFYDFLINQGIKQDHIITIELDRRKMFNLHDPDKLCDYVIDKLKDRNKYFIFIDEIQMCDEFESVLNEFLHYDNVDVYVTGSNSKMLSKDILTTFRGRGCQIKLYPMSFAEFYVATKQNIFDQAWKEYFVFGGMPYVLHKDTHEEKINYLNDLFIETYIKDIKERCHVQNEKLLSDLINILASSVGSFTNYLKIVNTIKSVSKETVSQNTVSKYLEILEESFLIRKSLKYDIKGKKYLTCPFKYYFTDVGLRNARLGFRQLEETHLMENIVFNELINRGYSVDTGIVTVNEKQKNNSYIRKQLECDFIINKANKKIYVQCCYSIHDLDKFEHELRPLNNINDSFKKIIITKDNVISYNTPQGIEVVSLKEFLLNDSWLGIDEDKYTFNKVSKVVKRFKI